MKAPPRDPCRQRWSAPLVFLLPLLLAPALLAQARDIEAVHHSFELSLGQKQATVSLRVSGLRREKLTVAMPVWRPGSYHILNFGKNVKNIRARDAKGGDLPVSAGENFHWTVSCGGQREVTIQYELPLPRGIGMRLPYEIKGKEEARRVRHHEAYLFQGPATWLYVPGRLDLPQHATFHLPEGWNVATGMKATEGKAGSFSCPDYDTFADCPFHIGKFETLRFEIDKVPYRIILSGYRPDRTDRKELVGRYEKIIKSQLHMMGKAPYEEYVFLVGRGRGRGGGGEHLNSTEISPGGLGRNTGHDSLVAHEFFHLWNVKRLRPQALGPFDYTGPVRSRYLWVCEGFTTYYAGITLVRAGVGDEKRYWTQSVGRQINMLQRNRGRLRLSVSEASWTVWDHPYLSRSARQKAPDYYNKGMLLGLLLDIEIRAATGGKSSLDDVMRGLYRQCMHEGRGFADGDVRKWCEKVSRRSFKQFFADYVDGVEELPFTEVLAKIGLEAKPLPVKAPKKQDPAKPPRRQRPPRWRVKLMEKPSKKALRLRQEMTRVVVK